MRHLLSITGLFAILALFSVWATPQAFAHGDVGDRTFPATLQFDDPSVGDEATFPQINRFKGAEDGEPGRYATEAEVEIERRLTDKFGISLGGAYAWEDDAGDESGAHGFDNFSVGAKYEFYDNDARELAMSLGVEAEIGGSGADSVGADYSVITPSLYFGKGAVELPGAWKPLALTGGIGVAIPTDKHSGDAHNATQLETSFAIQYSLPYLQQQGTYVAPLFANLTPIVEFHYETPFGGGETTGTVNPGVIWSNDKVQFGLEAMLPAASNSGQGVGFTAQLHFYLDDLMPAAFGKPVFGD